MGDYKILRLKNVESPWNKQHYIGFVLDILNIHLELNVKEYQLDGGFLPDRNSGIINNANVKIRVDRVGEGLYVIQGFPKDKDFIDFEEKAQGLLEELLKMPTNSI